MHHDVEFLIGKHGRSYVTTLDDTADGFIIHYTGGDGPMIIELEQMREKHQSLLGERVQLLGSISHEQVRDVS